MSEEKVIGHVTPAQASETEFKNKKLQDLIEATRNKAAEPQGPWVDIAGWRGEGVADDMMLINGLSIVSKLEGLCKKFKAQCKEYVEAKGEGVRDAKGRKYDRYETVREQKCGMSLVELGQLLMDLKCDEFFMREFLQALQQRGVGEKKVVGQYRWK